MRHGPRGEETNVRGPKEDAYVLRVEWEAHVTALEHGIWDAVDARRDLTEIWEPLTATEADRRLADKRPGTACLRAQTAVHGPGTMRGGPAWGESRRQTRGSCRSGHHTAQ